jgi:integrase
MSNVKFYLKRNTPLQETAISARVRINKSVFKYGIGKSIIPELWDMENQRPITVKKKIKPYRKSNPQIDIELENIKTRIENIEREISKKIESYEKENEIIDLSQLRDYLDSQYKTVKKPTKTKSKDGPETLSDFIEDHIKNIENGETYQVGSKIKKYSKSTIKVYKEWKTQYLAFQKSKRKIYNFNDIDDNFYKQYVEYFVKKNYTTNSTGKQIKNLKAILNVAYKRKLHQNLAFKDFVVLKEETESIYLTNSELELLYNIDLSERPHLDKVRDVFLVGCWTALRFSDYKRIKPSFIIEKNKVNYLRLTTQKTTEKVIIPIRPELLTILEKYDFKLPKTYEQKVNEHIKTIAKELEIDEPTPITKTKGGLTVETTVPKYKLIQTHTARRTGATLMYKAGIPILDICKITGHKKPDSLLRYIKTSKEETAEKLSTNEFFTGQKLRAV